MIEKLFCGITMKRVFRAALTLAMVLSFVAISRITISADAPTWVKVEKYGETFWYDSSMVTYTVDDPYESWSCAECSCSYIYNGSSWISKYACSHFSLTDPNSITIIYDGSWKLNGGTISLHDTIGSGANCTAIAQFGELYVDGTRCYAPYTLTAAAEVVIIHGRYLKLCTNHSDNGNCRCNTCNNYQLTTNSDWNAVKSLLTGNYGGTLTYESNSYTMRISVQDGSILLNGTEEVTPYHVKTSGDRIAVLSHPESNAYDELLTFTIDGTKASKVTYPTELGEITCFYIEPIDFINITSNPLQYVSAGGSLKLVNANGNDATVSDIILGNDADYTVSQIGIMEDGPYKLGVALLVPNDGCEFVDGFTIFGNSYESGYSSNTENLVMDSFTAGYFDEALPNVKPGDVVVCWLASEYSGETPPVTGDSNAVWYLPLLMIAGLGLIGSFTLFDKRRRKEL